MLSSQSFLLPLIEKNFGIQNLKVVKMLGGWGDTIRWKLNDSKGQQFFLKEKVYTLTPEDFRFHLNLQSFMYLNNAPVPKIFHTKSNIPYIYASNKYYELQEWIEGKTFLPSDVLAYSYSESLIKVLKSANLYSSPKEKRWDWPRLRNKFFPDQALPIIKYTKNHLQILCKDNPALLKEFNYIFSALTYHIKQVCWEALPTQFIHGDISVDNALLREDSIIFFDLDDARWSYRLWEIVTALINYSLIYPKHDVQAINLQEAWNKSSFYIILERLIEEKLLSPLELDCLKDMLVIATIITIIAEFDLDDPDPCPVPLETIISLIRVYIDNIKEI